MAHQSSQCGPGQRPIAGASEASDHQILTLLLRAASERGGEQLSAMLLSKFGSLARVIAASRNQLLLIEGLGSDGVTRLKVVHTAALRLLRADVTNGPVLSNWRRLTRYLHAVLAHESVEQLHILFLDNCYRLLEDETHQHGTVNHVPMYPREVARRALELDASALILAHNHPSGNPTPSPDDIAATKKIRNALATISIELLDHIVIGNGRYVSLREQGFIGGHKRDVVKGKRCGAIAGAAASASRSKAAQQYRRMARAGPHRWPPRGPPARASDANSDIV